MINYKEKMKRIRDYADCADASYAMLDYVFNDIDAFFDSDKWNGADTIRLGDKKTITITEFDIKTTKEVNTAYARCIEARFMKDVVLEKGIFKDTTIDNNPINIHIDSTLSTRTKNFVNRYEIKLHQPNTSSGFSATLFQNKQTKEYILSFRGTELGTEKLEDTMNDLYADLLLAQNKISRQYYDMIDFIENEIKPRIYNQLTKKYEKIAIVGHSLGGYLAQRFCPIICYNQ